MGDVGALGMAGEPGQSQLKILQPILQEKPLGEKPFHRQNHVISHENPPREREANPLWDGAMLRRGYVGCRSSELWPKVPLPLRRLPALVGQGTV